MKQDQTVATTDKKVAIFNPENFDQAMKMADVLAKSNMVPKAYRGQPADIVVAMEFGREVGLRPLQSLQSIACVNGTPALYGDGALALVRASGLLEDFKESDPNEALKQGFGKCWLKRKGQKEPIERTFSIEDAKKAQLWDKKSSTGYPSPWILYAGRMLLMRARAWALRDGFADVLKGLAIAEEVQDIEPMRDVTPPAEAMPQMPVLKKIVHGALEKAFSGPATPGGVLDQMVFNSRAIGLSEADLAAVVDPSKDEPKAESKKEAESVQESRQESNQPDRGSVRVVLASIGLQPNRDKKTGKITSYILISESGEVMNIRDITLVKMLKEGRDAGQCAELVYKTFGSVKILKNVVPLTLEEFEAGQIKAQSEAEALPLS